mmetsp:Transcript_15360/g.39584  ORF Transcript_15360/g.39584 Transcript_15360/m.39584 type:complete len:185 (-) Transcript_15360:431-985(-)|eukprot:CAMPEP_0182924728 /NCGR_PEP_ID=MMETSP0105_2-20130417/7108_1 /TAXON_ID=81532 ORGANISM="Acanthoeca-like sp., Strain 10tr" /NCGR_SAMPLE_ID=MMETSP0105_2 /ASSEMBLY_ACC=CAM_ASM_000205 /LENGTH=184 /DNA_ID=CAMNT_0025062529 /DNA_START=280 /DNA_END=834 /DNA_ORIENTATION=+
MPGADAGVAAGDDAFWMAERSRTSWAEPQPDGASQSPDIRDTFTMQSTEEYVVQYLGTITGVRRTEKEVVACIDQAKRSGNVAWNASLTHDSLRLVITKYGFKVMDVNRKEVLLRVPMHKIGWVVHYTETTGQQIVVIESGVPGGEVFKYFLYQSQSESQAAKICETFADAFKLVHKNSQLESM